MDYLPSSDAGLLAWSANFSSKIATGYASFGLTSANATAYAAKQLAYASALTAATEPDTRGPHNVLLKNEKRRELVQISRQMGQQVQGTMTVTNAQRQELGLNVRVEPQPIPAPGSAPDIDIVHVDGHTVRIRLHEAGNPARRKPFGVSGASVFSFVGEEAPTDPAAYKFEGSTTRNVVDIAFGPAVPAGAKVWITAFWWNPRALSGPACDPVTTNLAGGGALPLAA